LKVAGSVSIWGIGVVVPSSISLGTRFFHTVFLPLARPRGVKGAAFAAWEEIVEVLPGTESVAGVKAGESTLSAFFAVLLYD
jgi:hypothetical protein